MIQPPDNYRDMEDTVMTNFDRSIDKGLEERLRQEKVTMQYTGRNFCGTVWFDGQFHCLICVYGSPRESVSLPKLEEIMDYVCSEYGPE